MLRSWFTVAVRRLTQCERTRWVNSSACCWTLLTGTRRTSLWVAVTQIARASPASSLFAADAFLDLVRGQQLDLVPQLGELATPMVGAGAGFHGDAAGLQWREELQELGALQLLAVDFTGVWLHPVHLEDTLC